MNGGGTGGGRAPVGSKLSRAAPVFAALGDETRLAIVARLCAGGPQSIARLAGGVAVSRQAVAKHLRALEVAGLARGRRSGREHIWELEAASLARVQDYLEEISLQWDAALGRLRALVEERE
ncbi:MAG TPA: metalloregulator ArsR/SmtB family transcription factor [Longimicrobiaceae bacterium]|nr:metalloregulator ArsR/SmtB family transcription factor [Longimicrobiaceae bacterium]